MSRRQLIQTIGLGIVGMNLPVWATQSMAKSFGSSSRLPLVGPDENGLLLPLGFRSRVVARSSQNIVDLNFRWHPAPDGGAVISNNGGWIYVSNAEVSESNEYPEGGGVSALVFNTDGDILNAYRLLRGTRRNCAGGLTPWGTWLSCEEFESIGRLSSKARRLYGRKLPNAGLVWETFPLQPERKPLVHVKMGAFQHEAAAFDDHGVCYLTEDQKDGCFYRYISSKSGDLSDGQLQVATHRYEDVIWRDVPDPTLKRGVPTRHQVEDALIFKGGEGADFLNGKIYFTTKRDDRVWCYEVDSKSFHIVYDRKNPIGKAHLTGVDNLVISPSGHVLVAEDGGNMELVALNNKGETVPLLRLTNQDRKISG